MSSYRQLLYHLVFRTKDSLPTINQDHTDQLYAYITGIIKNKSSHLYRINGVENHLHILTDLHPSIALADFLREIKASSSLWMKNSDYFPAFNGWSEGYGSFRAGRDCILKRSEMRNRIRLIADELTEGNLPSNRKIKELMRMISHIH